MRSDRGRRALWRATAVWSAGAAAGCAHYQVAAPDAVPAGAHVRVSLTANGTAALARTPVGSAVVGVEGTWVRAGADSVRVRADRLLTSAGVPVAWSGGEIGLPRDGVSGVERRTADGARTALLVVSTAALGVLVVRAARRAGSGASGGGSSGPTPF